MAHGLVLRMKDMLEYQKNEMVPDVGDPVYMTSKINVSDEVNMIQSWINAVKHPQHSKMEYFTLLRKTLLLIFSTEWSNSTYQKDIMGAFKFHYEKFSTITDNTTQVYNCVRHISENPWGNSFFWWKELFDGKLTFKDKSVQEYFESEPEDIVLARVHSLVIQGRIFPAMCLAKTSFLYHSRIAKSFRHPLERSDSVECTTVVGHSSIDWFMYILKKINSLDIIVNEVQQFKCHEGIEVIYRLWRNHKNRKFCYSLLQIFILQDLMQDSTFCCTEKLFTMFCLMHKELRSSPREIVECTHKLLSIHAPTSAHFYLFVDVAWKQFGMKCLDLYVEFYVRGLTIDLNHLENKRNLGVLSDVAYLETHIAAVFSKLSTLFIGSYDEVARECMFSAFSLRPSKEKLYVLQKLTRSLSYNKRQPKSLSIDSGLSSNCCCGLRCIGHCRAILSSNSFSHPLLINGIGNISHYIVRDFVSILESARCINFQYNFFDWRYNVTDLEDYCKSFIQKKNTLKGQASDTEVMANGDSSNSCPENIDSPMEDHKDAIMKSQIQSVQSSIKRKRNSICKNEIILMDVGANIEVQSDDNTSKRIKMVKPPENFIQTMEGTIEDVIKKTLNINIAKGQRAVYTLPGKSVNQFEGENLLIESKQQVNRPPSCTAEFGKPENLSSKSLFDNKTGKLQRSYENQNKSYLTNPLKIQTSTTSSHDNSRQSVVVAPENITPLKRNHIYEHQNIHDFVAKSISLYSKLPNEVHAKGNGMLKKERSINIEDAINLNYTKKHEKDRHVQKYRQTSPFVSSQPPPKSFSRTQSTVLPSTSNTQNVTNLTPFETKKLISLDRNSVIRHTMNVDDKSFQIPSQLSVSIKGNEMHKVRNNFLRDDSVLSKFHNISDKSIPRTDHSISVNLQLPHKSVNINSSVSLPIVSNSSSHIKSKMTIIPDINSPSVIKTHQWTATLQNHGKTCFSTKIPGNAVASTSVKKVYHKPHKRHLVPDAKSVDSEKKLIINKSKIDNLERNFQEIPKNNQQWPTASNMLNYSNNQLHNENVFNSIKIPRKAAVHAQNSSSNQFSQLRSTISSSNTSADASIMRNYCSSDQQNDNFLSFTKHQLETSELVKSSSNSQHLQHHFTNSSCSSSMGTTGVVNYSSDQHHENRLLNSSNHEWKVNSQVHNSVNNQPLELCPTSNLCNTPLKTSEQSWYSSSYPKIITSTTSYSTANNAKAASSSIGSPTNNKDSTYSILNSCNYSNSATVQSEQTPSSLLKSRLTSSHNIQSYPYIETYSPSNSYISAPTKTFSGNPDCSQKRLSIKSFSELPSDVSSSLFTSSSSSVITSSLTNPSQTQFSSSLPSNSVLSRDERNVVIYQTKNSISPSQSSNIHNANANFLSQPCCSPLELNPCDSCSASTKFNQQQFLIKTEATDVQSSQANNQVNGDECFQLSRNIYQLNEMDDPHTICNFCSFSFPTSLIELHMEEAHSQKSYCAQTEDSYKETLNPKIFNDTEYNVQDNNEISVESSNHGVCSSILDAENSQNTEQLFSSIFDILKDNQNIYKNKDNVLGISENTHPLNLYPNESPCDISRSGSLSEMLKQVDFSQNVSPNLSAICGNSIMDCNIGNKQSNIESSGNKEHEKSWLNDLGLDPLSNSGIIENKKANFEVSSYETLELEKSCSENLGLNPGRDDLKNVLEKQNFKNLACLKQMPKVIKHSEAGKFMDPNIPQTNKEGRPQNMFQQQLTVSNSIYDEELNSSVDLLQHVNAYHSHTSNDPCVMQNVSGTSFINDTNNPINNDLMQASQIFDFDPYLSDSASKEVYKPLQKGRSKVTSNNKAKCKFKDVESGENKIQLKSETLQIDKKALTSKKCLKSPCKYCGKLILHMKQHILNQHQGHDYVLENSSTDLNSKQLADTSSALDHENLSNIYVSSLLHEDINTNTCLSPSDALNDIAGNFENLNYGISDKHVGPNHTVSNDKNEVQKCGLKFKKDGKINCHLCIRTYSSKSFLVKHMKTFHGLKDFSESDIQKNNGTEFKSDSSKLYPYSEERSVSKLDNHQIELQKSVIHNLINESNTDNQSYLVLKSKIDQLSSLSNQGDKLCLQLDSKDSNLVAGVEKGKKNVPKIHKCNICGKSFAYEKNLMKHLKIIHSVDSNPSLKNASQKIDDNQNVQSNVKSNLHCISDKEMSTIQNKLPLHTGQSSSEELHPKDAELVQENRITHSPITLTSLSDNNSFKSNEKFVSVSSMQDKNTYSKSGKMGEQISTSLPMLEKNSWNPNVMQHSEESNEMCLISDNNIVRNGVKNITQHEVKGTVHSGSKKIIPKNGNIFASKSSMKGCFKCVYCGKELTTLNRFKRHISIRHSNCISADVISQNFESKDKSMCVENKLLFHHKENSHSSIQTAHQSNRNVAISAMKSPICTNNTDNEDSKNQFINSSEANQSYFAENENLSQEGMNSDFQDNIVESANEISQESSSKTHYENCPCSSNTEQQFSDKCNFLKCMISDENHSSASATCFRGSSVNSFNSHNLSEILEDFEGINEPLNVASRNEHISMYGRVCTNNVYEARAVSKQCNTETNSVGKMHKSDTKHYEPSCYSIDLKNNSSNKNGNSVIEKSAFLNSKIDIKSSLISSRLLGEQNRTENYASSDESIVKDSSREVASCMGKNGNDLGIKNFIGDETSKNLIPHFEQHLDNSKKVSTSTYLKDTSKYSVLGNPNDSFTELLQNDRVTQEISGKSTIELFKESQSVKAVFENNECLKSYEENHSASENSTESNTSGNQNVHPLSPDKENSIISNNKDMPNSLKGNRNILPQQAQNVITSSATSPIEKQMDVITDELKILNYENHVKLKKSLKETDSHLSLQNQLTAINSTATLNVNEIDEQSVDKIPNSEVNVSSVTHKSEEKNMPKLNPEFDPYSSYMHSKQLKSIEHTREFKNDYLRSGFIDIVPKIETSNAVHSSSDKFLSVRSSPGAVDVKNPDSFCVPGASPRNMACLSSKVLPCEFSKNDENSQHLDDFNVSSSDVLPTLSVNEASSLSFLIKDYQCSDDFDLPTENFNDFSDDKIKMTAVESQPSPNIFVGDNEKDEDSENARKCLVSLGENFLALNNPVFSSCMVTSIVEDLSNENFQDSLNGNVLDLQCNKNSDENSIFELQLPSQQVIKQIVDDIVNLVCCDENAVVHFDSKNNKDEKYFENTVIPTLEELKVSFNSSCTDEGSLNAIQNYNKDVPILNENSIVNSLNESNAIIANFKKCRLCHKVFESMKDLSQHLKVIHEVPVLKRQISALQINSNNEGAEKLSPPQLFLQYHYDSDSTSTSSETAPVKFCERKLSEFCTESIELKEIENNLKLSISNSCVETVHVGDEQTESIDNIKSSYGISHQTSLEYKCEKSLEITQNTLHGNKACNEASVSTTCNEKQSNELKIETSSNEHVSASNVISDIKSTQLKCVIRVCKDKRNSVFYEIDNSKNDASEKIIEKQKDASTLLKNTKQNSMKTVTCKQVIKRSSERYKCKKNIMFRNGKKRFAVAKKTIYKKLPGASLKRNRLRSKSTLKKSNVSNIFVITNKKNKTKLNYSDILTFKSPKDIEQFLIDHKQPMVQLTRIKNSFQNDWNGSIQSKSQSCSRNNYNDIVAKRPLVKLERLIITPDMKIGNMQIREKISVIIPKLPAINNDKGLLSKVSSQSTNCQSDSITKNFVTLPIIKECRVLLRKLPL
ncbi:uncharacterized protein NPIL_247641 [Nephila pilipes]|uniref:C2H2-type domain-containing protein n=1 Tax=Nephila pilipes TaxID=299642 RepID=A0A8X6KI47_NEPPI|nr:uncharacterized protein NPIL_247641 [Nephila pilipes]